MLATWVAIGTVFPCAFTAIVAGKKRRPKRRREAQAGDFLPTTSERAE